MPVQTTKTGQINFQMCPPSPLSFPPCNADSDVVHSQHGYHCSGGQGNGGNRPERRGRLYGQGWELPTLEAPGWPTCPVAPKR